jgi:hypothetical protein
MHAKYIYQETAQYIAESERQGLPLIDQIGLKSYTLNVNSLHSNGRIAGQAGGMYTVYMYQDSMQASKYTV